MTRAWTLASLVALCACDSKSSPPPPAPTPTAPAPAPTIDRAALLSGKLPDGAPETDLINAQCRICHGVEYLTQQRLGETAWKTTLIKMRKFGARLTDDEAALLATFAARYWNPDLPGRTWKLGPPPAGALPIASPSMP